MDRSQLKHGHFFKVTEAGEIPLFDEWCKSIKRWALSNSNHDGYLYPPKRIYPKRTNQQNKAVVGLWMGIIMDEFYGEGGWDEVDKISSYSQFKIEMGWVKKLVNKKTGEVTIVPAETRNLDKPGYAEFMEKFAQHIASRHGIYLPPPDKALAVI